MSVNISSAFILFIWVFMVLSKVMGWASLSMDEKVPCFWLDEGSCSAGLCAVSVGLFFLLWFPSLSHISSHAFCFQPHYGLGGPPWVVWPAI